MANYVINDLNLSGYEKIVTLLNYKEKISTILKNIQLPSGGKVLVDAALVSGLNSYRFIEPKINKDGSLNLNQYHYPEVSQGILQTANSIIREEPLWLENSILTKSQKEQLTAV